ncbi:type IV secretory system conjugative DNA transfer family protein [Paenibacillus agricola]|uniref:Type IV secretory system conjugative DNA transfer family protein n=1 Tax=Paenibacillus agricola TaxID=2716264 RepID=A0ABX0JHI1_9BACL|nr:type IV secretory system conjugative DNA transfer family protein [Paenibacillus agricola]NHN34870.1 type IV secretory system conjugative DNA transfer family protein [Paenibacillus agricola]
MVAVATKEKIMWGGMDAFTHLLIVGPTRCGKTATILKPIIYQLLMAKKKGKRCGLTVIEPKGDVARMVADTSIALGLPYNHIDPLDDNSGIFNVMEGDIDDISEATVTVLKSLFGKQEAFFSIIQELSARKITQLLKTLHGDDINLMDVVMTIRDPKALDNKVAALKKIEGSSDLVQFFETELLGAQRQEYQKYVMGLRGQLENITSNRYLKKVLMGKSSFNLDAHLELGGILAINTAMGKLRDAGDAFGQFAMMHLQSATYRRTGSESTRIPHYMIIDEASRYMTPENERFLSIAAEYKTAGIFAVQSLAQLEVESGKLSGRAMKQAFMTSCRNKIIFVGVGAVDAKEMEREFGEDPITERQSTYKPHLLKPKFMPDSYRDTEKTKLRYTYTQIMDGIPKYHFFHKMLSDGHPQRPKIGKGVFIPKDWREQLLDNEVAQLEKGDFNLIKWCVKNYKANVERAKVLEELENATNGKESKDLSNDIDALEAKPLSKLKFIVKQKQPEELAKLPKADRPEVHEHEKTRQPVLQPIETVKSKAVEVSEQPEAAKKQSEALRNQLDIASGKKKDDFFLAGEMDLIEKN